MALCWKKRNLFAPSAAIVAKRLVSQILAWRSGAGTTTGAETERGTPFSNVLQSALVSDGPLLNEFVSQQSADAVCGKAQASAQALTAGTHAKSSNAANVERRIFIGSTNCLAWFDPCAKVGMKSASRFQHQSARAVLAGQMHSGHVLPRSALKH